MILNVSDGEFYTARRILTDLAVEGTLVNYWLRQYYDGQVSYHWMLIEVVKQLAHSNEARRAEIERLVESSTRPMVIHLEKDALDRLWKNLTETTSTQDTEQFEQLQLEWVGE